MSKDFSMGIAYATAITVINFDRKDLFILLFILREAKGTNHPD